MSFTTINNRSVSAILLAAMTVLFGLAMNSRPPLLQVSEMDVVEDGMVVRVFGIVADIRNFDSGYASVLLADHVTGDTVSIMFEPEPVQATLSDLSIGDEVLVEGTAAVEPSRTTVFANAENARILSKAAFTMSLEFLCSNWRLFEFDRFNVSGVIVAEPDSGDLWLTDTLSGHRIRMFLGSESAVVFSGDEAILDCTLLVDTQTMNLFLRVWFTKVVAA